MLHDNTLYRWARLAHSDRDSGSCATVNAHHGAKHNAHSALVSKYYNYSIRQPPCALQIKKAPNLVGSLA